MYLLTENYFRFSSHVCVFWIIPDIFKLVDAIIITFVSHLSNEITPYVFKVITDG